MTNKIEINGLEFAQLADGRWMLTFKGDTVAIVSDAAAKRFLDQRPGAIAERF